MRDLSLGEGTKHDCQQIGWAAWSMLVFVGTAARLSSPKSSVAVRRINLTSIDVKSFHAYTLCLHPTGFFAQKREKT
jgi:hypothetical protein